MKKLVLATAVALGLASPAGADIVGTVDILSDHCGCGAAGTGGSAQSSFGTLTVTDHENGVLDFSISLINGNKFANGGQGVTFGYSLDGTPLVTYSNLLTNLWTVPGGIDNGDGTISQNAASIHADGFGDVKYGLDLDNSGASGNPPSTLTFTLTAAGLDITDFINSTGGDPNAPFVFDIFSGSNGKTGFVDAGALHVVPGPIVGAGLPGLVMALLGMVGLQRRRRQLVG